MCPDTNYFSAVYDLARAIESQEVYKGHIFKLFADPDLQKDPATIAARVG